jgi:hypothetical protein
MEITRKDAMQITTDITENIMQNGYEYWIYYKGICIPFDKAMSILKQFIENPSLTSIETPTFKKDKK